MNFPNFPYFNAYVWAEGLPHKADATLPKWESLS